MTRPTGLSSDRAAEHFAQYGPNEIARARGPSAAVRRDDDCYDCELVLPPFRCESAAWHIHRMHSQFGSARANASVVCGLVDPERSPADQVLVERGYLVKLRGCAG